MGANATSRVFKTTRSNRVIALALGCALSVGGVLMIMDDSGSLLGYAFSPRLRASTVGWLVLGLGIVVTAAVFLGFVGDCPVLELNKDGIIYTRCFQGVTRIAWKEFDRIDIKKTTVPSSSGSDIELVDMRIITTDNRRIAIASLAPPEQMQDAINQYAAQFR